VIKGEVMSMPLYAGSESWAACCADLARKRKTFGDSRLVQLASGFIGGSAVSVADGFQLGCLCTIIFRRVLRLSVRHIVREKRWSVLFGASMGRERIR